jgi:hypothetical protein
MLETMIQTGLLSRHRHCDTSYWFVDMKMPTNLVKLDSSLVIT